MKLNKRELAMVLHSLRRTQAIILTGTDISECLHFAGEDIKPLKTDEVDALCLRLNTVERRGTTSRLYCITVTSTKTDRELTKIVGRAKSYVQAKKVASDVLREMWPKGKKRGVVVKLTIEPLVEPENGGTGYCYPVVGTDRVYMYTFA